MPMRRWPAAWRDVHINYAEACIRVFARYSDGVGVANQTNMRKVIGLASVRLRLPFKELHPPISDVGKVLCPVYLRHRVRHG